MMAQIAIQVFSTFAKQLLASRVNNLAMVKNGWA
jgi:hypothetical protein